MDIYLTIIIFIVLFLFCVSLPFLGENATPSAKGSLSRKAESHPVVPRRSGDCTRPRDRKGVIRGSMRYDDLLVKTYRERRNYVKRVVLIIESFENVEALVALIRNILNQEIKVDSIILISSDQTLKNNSLIRDTCILNKVGGLSFLFKESGNNTILVFVFSEGFNVFSNPHFLKKFIETNEQNGTPSPFGRGLAFAQRAKGIPSKGIVKVDLSNVHLDINKIY
jgi:hypothetical protein